MYNSSICVLDLNSLQSILIAVCDMSGGIGIAQQNDVRDRHSGETNGD